ncbi:MAG: translational GTPase TypA [Nitrospinae bacterium]|nr:translational GTPase TypA [Nitrospinota bacterium]
MDQEFIRNVGIIAHVDHGKTTLIDCLLRQSGMFRDSELSGTCIMDSNELEKERGITIFAKSASIRYKGYKINIVDTPGHADFGGEVERIIRMVNGVLLLVDAADGPMPQTKFVLKKSLERGLKPIVVINKIDRPGAQPEKAVDQIFDLFIHLGASDEQLDFPVIYTSAKQGYSRLTPDGEDRDMTAVLDLVLDKVPADNGNPDGGFQMQVTSIDYSDYVGRIGIGKIVRGRANAKSQLALIRRSGAVESFKASRIFTYEGLRQTETEEACTGDIIGVAGMKDIDIGETIADFKYPDPLPLLVIDEPTLSINISINDSPFAGREGKYLTSRHVRERLFKEARSNVALRVRETEYQDTFKVSGRGELHLTILIETMRREGYEFSISRPEVVLKKTEDGLMEPEEFAVIDVEDGYTGKVMEAMGRRKGSLKSMTSAPNGTARLEFVVPTRSFFGFQSEFMTLTKGTGIVNRIFHGYVPYCGEMAQRINGALISQLNGVATSYSLFNLQERGRMFLDPGEEVYTGMIVGENSRDNDLVVNICREKKLTNMRASGSDENIILTPPIKMSLEQILGYLNEDELAEITPKNIRLRKKLLDENERKRFARAYQTA